MAVRSTQCQIKAVRSTQGGRGVSPSVMRLGLRIIYMFHYTKRKLLRSRTRDDARDNGGDLDDSGHDDTGQHTQAHSHEDHGQEVAHQRQRCACLVR